MPILLILTVLVQIAFAVHVIKTGREYFWIYIIIILPGIGCAIYFITQVLPDMGKSHHVRKASSTLLKAVDPQRELRRRRDELALSDTMENRLKLAEECLEAGMSQDALDLLKACLRGGNETDPHILLIIAQAQFDTDQFDKTKKTLELLIAENPNFKSHEGHLMFARVLEELGETEAALTEYSVLARSYPGEEARVRYGLLLHKNKQLEKAKEIFNECVLRAKQSPKYYQKKEKQWLKIAEQHIG